MDAITKPPIAPFCPVAFFAKHWQSLLLLVLFLLLGLILWQNSPATYQWQWFRVWRFIGTFSEGTFSPGPLLHGLWLTILLALASLAASIPLALLVCAMRLSSSPVARMLAGGFLGCTRNTPLLMQLFLVYFVVSPVFNLGPFGSAVFALAAFEGSYMAEIFRGGVLGIPRHQWEAALSLGMSTLEAARTIILPQALRKVLPSFTGQVVSLIKDTSLVSAIAVADLTMRAQEKIADTFLSFEIWLLVAAMYLVLTLMVSLPARLLEQRYRW